MDINVNEQNGIINIALVGRLDSLSSETVTEKLISLIKEQVKMEIDMQQCPYVSSAGLRTLLTVSKRIKMQNGNLKLLNLVEEVKDVIEMTGFSAVFEGFN